MKSIVFLALLSLLSCQKEISSAQPTITVANSVEQILDNMKLCHEAIPHGVPSSFDWRKCPRVDYGNNPGEMTAMIPWGQVYEEIGGSKSSNTRVQIRNLRTYYLSKKDNS
jgi:hypothetical protein